MHAHRGLRYLVCVCGAFYSPTTRYLSYNKMYFQRSADHRESFKFGVFSKNALFRSYAIFTPFRHFVLLCVCYHVFANYTVQWGMEKVSNLAFSIETLHLKVVTLFHFKLNMLYIRLCLLPCFLQRYIRG